MSTAGSEPPRERVLLARHATALLRTEVFLLADGRGEWLRTPGAHNPVRFGAVPEALRPVLHRVEAPGARFALPDLVGDALRYLVPSPHSVAYHLADGGTELPETLPALFEGVGTLLRALHRTTPPPMVAKSPAPLQRTGRWFAAGDEPESAERFRDLARNRLGQQRWDVLSRWCEQLAAEPHQAVLVHGNPVPGNMVPGRAGAPGALVTGPDLAAGRPESDLGWLLGTLVEFEQSAARGLGKFHTGGYAPLRSAFLRGYGADFDQRLADWAAVLRVFGHAGDFAVYAGGSPQLPLFLDLVADLVDERAG